MVKSKKNNSQPQYGRKISTIEDFESQLKSRFEKSCSCVSQNVQIANSVKSELAKISWKISSSELPISSCYTCSICSCLYAAVISEPICLPCGHSFCRACVFSLKNSVLTGNCPYDSKEFFYIEDLLPINYALLNAPNDQHSRLCPEHTLQMLGFCLTDSRLLCGRCIFLHKNHDFIELDSNTANELAQAKLENLKNLEKQLKDLLISWEAYQTALSEAEEKMQKVINSHVDHLRKVESDVILEVHSRTEKLIKCILEYQGIISRKGSSSVAEVIECIKQNLECARNVKGMFSFMTNCEKLTLIIKENLIFEKPADFTLKDATEKFKDKFHYKDFILGTT